MEFSGKAALVTGGASGLGEATVERLIAGGACVAIFDLNVERGTALAQRYGAQALFRQVDVADEQGAGQAIDDVVRAFGAIHICINAAGVGGVGPTLTEQGPLPLAEFRRPFEVNLFGTFNIARLAAAKMMHNEPVGASRERGVIVNTGSISGFEPPPGMVAYGSSKAAVAAMTSPMARDLARYGIRVCTIAPGIFETPMLASLPPGMHEQLVATVPFPVRGGEPAEYAQLVTAIIENAYLNAAVIRLDGGAR